MIRTFTDLPQRGGTREKLCRFGSEEKGDRGAPSISSRCILCTADRMYEGWSPTPHVRA